MTRLPRLPRPGDVHWGNDLLLILRLLIVAVGLLSVAVLCLAVAMAVRA